MSWSSHSIASWTSSSKCSQQRPRSSRCTRSPRALCFTAAKIRKGRMLLEPALRLLDNARGERGKQYVPPEHFGADVLVPALRMPAYWRRLKGDENAVDPIELHSLPVASPPIVCEWCWEGFCDIGSLFKHCWEKHVDPAEYRKRTAMASCRCCRGRRGTSFSQLAFT